MFGFGHRYTVRPNDDGLVFGMSPVIVFSMAIFVTMMLLVFRTPPVQKLSNKKLLKSVKGSLLVGIYHDLFPEVILQSLDTMNQQYGKIYDFFVFSKHFIVTSDLKLCNEVLLQIPGLFRHVACAGDSPLSILKLQCDVFSTGTDNSDIPLDQSLMDSLVDRLVTLSKDNNSIDAKEELFQFVRNIVVRKVLNIDAATNSDSKCCDYFNSTQLARDIHAINVYTQPYLFAMPFYTWRRLPHVSVLETAAVAANHRLTAMCRDVVVRRRTEFDLRSGLSAEISLLNILLVQLKESKCALAVLSSESSSSSSARRVSRHSKARVATEESSAAAETDKLVATVKHRLLHQCDSSAIALCGLLLHLSQSGEALSRVRDEIETLLCGREAVTARSDAGAQNISPFSLSSSSSSSIGPLTALDLQRMASPSSLPFATAVLKEATRLSPAVPYFAVGEWFDISILC
jgi:hypothetical protein